MSSVFGFAALFAVFAIVAIAVGSENGSSTADADPGKVRGVLYATAVPELTAEELSLLDDLVRVDSLDELEQVITNETSVLVIDSSAFASLPEGYLSARASEGRAIVGLNIFGNDLARAAAFPSGGWATPEEWAKTHDGHGEGSFYSYMYRSSAGATRQHSGGGQHHFKDRLFPAVLGQLLEGNWRQ